MASLRAMAPPRLDRPARLSSWTLPARRALEAGMERHARLLRDRCRGHQQAHEPRQPGPLGSRLRRQLRVPGHGPTTASARARSDTSRGRVAAARSTTSLRSRSCSCRAAAGWSAASWSTTRSSCRASAIRRAPPMCSGPSAARLSPAMLARCHHVVRIPTRFCINLAVAGAIVMYDRMLSHRPVRRRGPCAAAARPSRCRPHVHGPMRRFGGVADARHRDATADASLLLSRATIYVWPRSPIEDRHVGAYATSAAFGLHRLGRGGSCRRSRSPRPAIRCQSDQRPPRLDRSTRSTDAKGGSATSRASRRSRTATTRAATPPPCSSRGCPATRRTSR